MIKSVWKFGDGLAEVEAIRASAGICSDEFDKKSIQLILTEDDIPVACGSLYFNAGAYHLAHICVLPAFQKQYIGDMLVRLLLFKAFNMGAEAVKITADAESADFFKRYGFNVTEAYNMLVTAETLVMESKCGHDCASCVNKDLCKNR